MEEEKFQKELFEYEPQKKSFSRLTDMLPKADFEGKVTLTITLEKMVFISIGIIMAMVIVYALGVESGKSASKMTSPQEVRSQGAVTLPINVQDRIAVIPDKNILNTSPVAPLIRPAAPSKQQPQSRPKAAIASQPSKAYTILACTFTKLENAQNAAAGLAKLGLTSSVSFSAPYYQVSAGGYTDKNSPEAQRDLIKVRRQYKDALFRLK